MTKTDWEGTGVQPDVKVPAGQALDTARKLAADKLAKSVTPRANRREPGPEPALMILHTRDDVAHVRALRAKITSSDTRDERRDCGDAALTAVAPVDAA